MLLLIVCVALYCVLSYYFTPQHVLTFTLRNCICQDILRDTYISRICIDVYIVIILLVFLKYYYIITYTNNPYHVRCTITNNSFTYTRYFLRVVCILSACFCEPLYAFLYTGGVHHII